MKQVIIKVQTNSKEITTHFAKYAQFFNNIINRTKKYELYLETIEDGFLFVYPSLNSAKKFFSFEYNKRNLTKNPFKKITDTFLRSIFFPKSRFPQKGVCIKAQVFPKKVQEIFFDLIERYFTSIHDDLTFIKEDPKTIKIHIKSVEAIHAYTNLIFNKFYFHKFLKK